MVGIARRVDKALRVTPPKGKLHRWTPWLHVDVHERDDEPAREHDRGTRVFGRFSPHPNLWTVFMFSCFGLGTVGVFAGCRGMSQMMLGGTPVAL